MDPALAPVALAQHLYRRTVEALKSLPKSPERGARQLQLANDILRVLAKSHKSSEPQDLLSPPARLLEAVALPVDGLAGPVPPVRPRIPLSMSELLVNGRHDLSIGAEVKRELASADRVDLLCSFLKWSGFRLVERHIREFLERRPGKLRVLTTAYMRATQARAIEELCQLGADVRVSYDTQRTRLHAKAWMFHRRSGFFTAFVGSSNLSAAALLDGAEWNVRLSQRDNAGIMRRFQATFDQYWTNPEFRRYDRDEFARAIQSQTDVAHALIFRFDIEPRPHQQEILDDLASERARGYFRNLVVAATGTGKTVVAALDYKRLREQLPGSRLLFVAHRRELLEQSLATYRVVLKDGNFGELHVGDDRPVHGKHVFASIQSLHARGVEALDPQAFDVVVVDEFHHAAAPSYERLLGHLRPRVLLGLTATPERTDGQSVLGWFDNRTASELRLWKALDQELLCPFQYFGVGGAPDAGGVRWSRGRYDTRQLSNLYTADHFFAKRIVQEVHAKIADVTKMRGLGFCVDVSHAKFMAEQFVKMGIPAVAVVGTTRSSERADALRQLQAREKNIVFCVDLFNEGVDVPEVDTVLFLRPTESATVFLQQLGRGLRRARDKECLTVLDFIGGANRKFRFDRRFRAILGGTRRHVLRTIEEGFPRLPSGCAIELDRQAQQAVLDNVRSSLKLGLRGLVEDLRQLAQEQGPDLGLQDFLSATGIDLEELYRSPGACWTALRRQAGLESIPPNKTLERAFSRMLHINDLQRFKGLRALVEQVDTPTAKLENPDHRALFVLLGHRRDPLAAMQDRWRELWSQPHLLSELRQLLAYLEDHARAITFGLGEIPLHVHATYTLDEVMAAMDERNSRGVFSGFKPGPISRSGIRPACTLSPSRSPRKITPRPRSTMITPFHRNGFTGRPKVVGTRVRRRVVAS